MKPAFLGLALVLASTLAGAESPLETRHQRESVTVDFLLEACTVVGQTARGLIPHFDCESYLYGVLDSHLAVRASLPKSAQACFPASIAPWQVYKQLTEAPHHPSQKLAGPFVMGVLVRAYPCK